jgi:O-antigen/teichoic acid export membrane protein
MELRLKTARGLIWSGTQQWGERVISLFVIAILSRLVSVDAFGLVAYATVFIALIQTFLDQGFGDAIIQREDLESEHLDTAFTSNIIAGSLFTLVSISLASLISGIFHEPRLISIIKWLSLTFTLSGLSVTQQAFLRRKLAFKELAVRSLIGVIAGGVVGITLAYMGFGVWSLVAQNLVKGVVGVIVLWKVSKWRPRLRFSRTHLKDLFPFGLNIIGTNLLNFINRRADEALIGYFLGSTMLGFYTVAYKLLTIMMDLLTGVTTAVAYPTFSRMQGDPDRMRRGLYQATYFTSLISFPAFLGVALLAPDLVVAIFGPQWAPSIPVMRVLSFIGILHSVFYFNCSVMLAAGKPSWRLGITLMNAVCNIIAFAIAVRWGIVAVAAAYVIRGYLLSPVPLWALRRLLRINIKEYLRQYAVAFLGSLLMILTILVFQHFTGDVLGLHARILTYVFIGCATYVLSIRIFDPSLTHQVLEFVRLVMPYVKEKKV